MFLFIMCTKLQQNRTMNSRLTAFHHCTRWWRRPFWKVTVDTAVVFYELSMFFLSLCTKFNQNWLINGRNLQTFHEVVRASAITHRKRAKIESCYARNRFFVWCWIVVLVETTKHVGCSYKRAQHIHARVEFVKSNYFPTLCIFLFWINGNLTNGWCFFGKLKRATRPAVFSKQVD
jgi:hypothetical protein